MALSMYIYIYIYAVYISIFPLWQTIEVSPNFTTQAVDFRGDSCPAWSRPWDARVCEESTVYPSDVK